MITYTQTHSYTLTDQDIEGRMETEGGERVLKNIEKNKKAKREGVKANVVPLGTYHKTELLTFIYILAKNGRKDGNEG